VVYTNFCLVCHAADACGQTPVTERGYPPPPSLLAHNARTIRDGRMFHILTYGQNNMPPYAALISPEDRWKAIVYVRSLQTRSTPTTNPTTAPAPEGAS
jgi:mono/diheme cytochrome c family protein